MESIITFTKGDVLILPLSALEIIKETETEKMFLESVLFGINEGTVICLNEEEGGKLLLIDKSDPDLFKELAYGLKTSKQPNDINVINKVKKIYEDIK